MIGNIDLKKAKKAKKESKAIQSEDKSAEDQKTLDNHHDDLKLVENDADSVIIVDDDTEIEDAFIKLEDLFEKLAIKFANDNLRD
jgi:hypothetical protein